MHWAFETPLNATREVFQTSNVISHERSTFRATVNRWGYDLDFITEEPSDDMAKRVLGCAFVSYMPSSALDETLSVLLDYYELESPPAALPEGIGVSSTHKGEVVQITGAPE